MATQTCYPTITQYLNAIRHPQIAFKDLDPELIAGKPVEIERMRGLKEPWSASGGCACVFKYETFNPSKIWAVRCFLRSISNASSHYSKVSNYIKTISCSPYFVNCDFLERGIRVDGNVYPTLKMEWAEGKDLRTFIKDNLANKVQLENLAHSWIKLSESLEKEGVAHGDLHHENVLVDESSGISLKLIDYDSLYWQKQDGNNVKDQIKGLPNYQHPLRDSVNNRCVQLDFFSQLVIYSSILALAENPNLWNQYKLEQAKERLLFSENDFKYPARSQIFAELAKFPSNVAKLSEQLKKICNETDFHQIPSLATVLKRINPAPIDATSFFTSKGQGSNAQNSTINPGSGQAWTASSSSSSTARSGSGQTWNPGGSTANPGSGQTWNPGSSSTNSKSGSGASGNSVNSGKTIQKLQTENQSLKKDCQDLESKLNAVKSKLQFLDIQIDRQQRSITIVKIIAAITTTFAITFGLVCYVQYQEREGVRRQIEQLKNGINSLPGKRDDRDSSIVLDDFTKQLKGEKTSIDIDLDHIDAAINFQNDRRKNLETSSQELKKKIAR